MPAIAASVGRGARLAIRDLRVGFGGVAALDGVSLDAAPGEIIGVIGPNGAGKTTLFNCISGTVRPSAGTILLDGAPLGRLPPHRRARIGVTRTFQNLALLDSLNVLDNVRLAAEQAGRQRSAAARADATRLVAALGLDAIARGPVGGLPVGTRRKVELARAIAGRPRLLLLDEPTSGLSEMETADVIAILRAQHAALGFTALLVEHQMPVVMALSDRIVALDFGRKIADGTPGAIRRDPLVLAAYLGAAS
ncbi:MAG: ABC transporter ATP-binding protein [Bauldia sp.]|nr:ABC transporter ATP-binding protein [Bauldia sp.]